MNNDERYGPPTSLPISLRRQRTEIEYQNAKKAGLVKPLHEEHRLAEWDHWFLIANRFPYDMTFKQCDMLLPKRKVANRYQLTLDEEEEYLKIIEELSGRYDVVMENLGAKRSVADHFNLHLLKYHDNRAEVYA